MASEQSAREKIKRLHDQGRYALAAERAKDLHASRPTPQNAALCASYLTRAGSTDVEAFRRLAAKYDLPYLWAATGEAAFRAGDLDTGFSLRRYRWALRDTVKTETGAKEWEGEDCPLVVVSEQGLGEQILYSCMFHRLPDSLIGVDARLIPIMQRTFPQHRFMPISELSQHVTPAHRQAYTVDLAAHHLPRQNTKPWLYPNLTSLGANAAGLKKAFPGKIPIGVSWRSHNDAWGNIKSIPCQDLLPLVTAPGVVSLSLQYGKHQGDLEYWKSVDHPVLCVKGMDMTSDLESVSGLISALKYVVTCSNTVAHLAGAMGVNTILMAPGSFSLWYWGRGDRTPWYPSVRILRGPPNKPWSDLSREALSMIISEQPKEASP